MTSTGAIQVNTPGKWLPACSHMLAQSSWCWPFEEGRTMLKIERKSDGKTTVIWLIDRIQSEHLDELKLQTNDKSERIILDLDEVTLVDADVVRFLSASEEAGIALVRCPLYVREWILRERDCSCSESESRQGY